LLEQLQLVVETVRIEVAVRPAKAQGEAPALSGLELALRLRQRRVLVEAAVPAEGDARRQLAGLVATRLGIEREPEAEAVRTGLR
jgi:hypothetical protein